MECIERHDLIWYRAISLQISKQWQEEEGLGRNKDSLGWQKPAAGRTV